jgi:hypothetical protein
MFVAGHDPELGLPLDLIFDSVELSGRPAEATRVPFLP